VLAPLSERVNVQALDRPKRFVHGDWWYREGLGYKRKPIRWQVGVENEQRLARNSKG
jgi:hypothetical protein